MARYQKRLVRLRKGRQTVNVEIEHGHVYVYERTDSGMVGHSLYDPKEEIALLEKLVRQHRAQGFVVIADTGLVGKTTKPKKPAAMDAKTWRWAQDADEMLATWRDDDYDNLKDAILDARAMIAKAPSSQAARLTRLERMHAKATKELAALAAEDPAMADYARGLLAPPKKAGAKRKHAKSKSTKKKSAKKKGAKVR